MGFESTIETLNAFLAAELSAVETYRQTLARISVGEHRERLRACLVSHERRVATLAREIRALGGRPVHATGDAWNAFSNLLSPHGDRDDEATLTLLEEGEDNGLKRYLDDVSKLDRDSRKMVEREILPEQMSTHDSVSDLKLTVEAAATESGQS